MRGAGVSSTGPSGLQAAVDELLARSSAHRGRRVQRVDIRPATYASSFSIHEVDVHFDDKTRFLLTCKNTSRVAMLEGSRRVKPRFLWDPLREIDAYATILEPFDIGAPALYGTRINRRRGQFWLLLERVMGPPLAEVGDFHVWIQVAAWLAHLHSRISPHACVGQSPALVRYDRASYERWWRRALRFVAERAGESGTRRARFRALARQRDSVIERVLELPVSFVHGDFFPSNVLVDGLPDRIRVRPLDWELAGIGTGLMDLAALTAGRWTDEQRRDLALAYFATLSDLVRPAVEPAGFLEAFDYCRVQLAVQYLGWARSWRPPAQHAHDWLADALSTAERLGL